MNFHPKVILSPFFDTQFFMGSADVFPKKKAKFKFYKSHAYTKNGIYFIK
jgi:hypothetical protein